MPGTQYALASITNTIHAYSCPYCPCPAASGQRTEQVMAKRGGNIHRVPHTSSCASLCFWCLRQQGPHPAMPFRQILDNWQSGSQHSHPIPHTSNPIPDSDTSPDTISDSRMSFYDFTAQHLIYSASFICFHWAHVFSGIYFCFLCVGRKLVLLLRPSSPNTS